MSKNKKGNQRGSSTESFISLAESLLERGDLPSNTKLTDTYLYVPQQSESGFDVGLSTIPELTIEWGTWHSPIPEYSLKNAFSLVHSMLTSQMRVRELYKWPFSYRGYLQRFDQGDWVTIQVMGLLIWNPLAPLRERIYQNTSLDSDAKHGANGT